MADVITSVEQLTPDRLTKLLRTKGVVEDGSIASIVVTKSRQTNVSTVYHLAIVYARGEPRAPAKLFLKIPVQSFHQQGWGNKEIRFYTDIVPAMRQSHAWSDLPFIRHYDVAYDKDTKRSHYLFEDLSDTFFAVDGRTPPTPEHRKKAVAAFALLHAFWWEHPRLTVDLGEGFSVDKIAKLLATTQVKFRKFAESRGEALSKWKAEVLQAVVSSWPARRVERLVAGKGITIVHRDPHPLNLLYSFSGREPNVKLIDWQSWRVDTGTDDLAYLMACHWPAALRETAEYGLVQHYHGELTRLGITGYSSDDCWYDYRASIIRCLFFLMAAWSPVQWERGWWWEKVEHGIEAFTSLDCAELLA